MYPLIKSTKKFLKHKEFTHTSHYKTVSLSAYIINVAPHYFFNLLSYTTSKKGERGGERVSIELCLLDAYQELTEPLPRSFQPDQLFYQ